MDDILVHAGISVNGTSTGTEERYLHKDHLESTETITDEAGAPATRMAFTPFGARRDNSWEDPSAAYQSTLPDLTFENTTKGFTGHEHLDGVGFIHMNGRMYDPEAGRFMSADSYVQFPEFSQSYNRYSYVLNNPLSHRDPSGEILPVVYYGAVIAWRACSAYDVVTNGVENVKTLADDNASLSDKGMAALDLGSRVIGTKKITEAAGAIASKGKWLANKLFGKGKSVQQNAKKIDNAASKAVGKDANTSNVGVKKLGDYGIARGQRGAIGDRGGAKKGGDFFEGAKYTDKVKRQMQQGDFHSFPESVKRLSGCRES